MKNIQNLDAYEKITLIFVATHTPPLKTVMPSHKWIFRSFLQKYSFFRKIVL